MIDQATLCQGVEAGTVAVCDAAVGASGFGAGGLGASGFGASGFGADGHRGGGHRAGDHGRLTTLTLSVCLRPAPATWRGTLTQLTRHHDG